MEPLQVKKELMDKIMEGCAGVTVIDARRFLHVQTDAFRGTKDFLKAKVIYLCSDMDAERVAAFVNTAIREAREKMPEKNLDYKVKHVGRVRDVILSGTQAHSVKIYKGTELGALIANEIPYMREEDVNEIGAFLAAIDPDRQYKLRTTTGTSYRATCFIENDQRRQYTVGNVLILSGPGTPSIRDVSARKRRSDITDTSKSLVLCAEIYPLD